MITLVSKASRRVQSIYRRTFRNRNHIFIHRGPVAPAQYDGYEIMRCDSWDEIPQPIRENMRRRGSEREETWDRRELDDGAIVWIAQVSCEPAAVLFTLVGAACVLLGRRPASALLGGAVLVLALLVKPTCMVVVLAIVLDRITRIGVGGKK